LLLIINLKQEVTNLKNFTDLTHSDVERILAIVDGLNDIEVHIEIEGMKLHVRKFSAASQASGAQLYSPVKTSPTPISQPVSTPDNTVTLAVPLAPTALLEGLIEIRAPMLGRFFHAPSPSEPQYVEIGSKIKAEDTVCTIEVMKLFSTIKAGVNGTIVNVLVKNGAMVEYDTVLFHVRPQ